MNTLNADLARMIVRQRLDSAREQQPGRRFERDQRGARRRARREALARWWRERTSPEPATEAPRLTLATSSPALTPTEELSLRLEMAAHRIANWGTSTESGLLEAIAAIVADSAPGAAAALLDPAGSEISRLRAFGHLHAHMLGVLGAAEHACLLDRLDGRGEALPDRVARTA